MTVERQSADPSKFNREAALPYELRLDDFKLAMQDVYDFFFDVNTRLVEKGLQRLDDMLRPAIMSGVLSDMLTASLAKHSRTLTEQRVRASVGAQAARFHRGLPRPGHRQRFSQEPARRTRHADRNASRRRNREAAAQLDLPSLIAVNLQGRKLRQRLFRRLEVTGVFLNPDAFVADRVRSGQRRPRASERIEHDSGTQRQNAAYELP